MPLHPQPIASYVLRCNEGTPHRRLWHRWATWAVEPGGVWFWVGNTLTRRGARRLLREFIA